MGFTPYPSGLQLTRQASTPVAGFALTDGTPNILTWTVPNDGALHWFMVPATVTVTVTQTGGNIGLNFYAPDGTQCFPTIADGGQGAGFNYAYTAAMFACKAGTEVILSQSSAMSEGTATVWAEIWGD